MSKSKYRITKKYPCYDGCIPITGYIVQKLEEGIFFNKWINIKGFDNLKDAEELIKILK